MEKLERENWWKSFPSLVSASRMIEFLKFLLIWDIVCAYRLKQIVCQPNLKQNLFTTSAVENIDVNPSSTPAKVSFHGIGISLFQRPRQPDDGTDRG
jgi:hypothetical protein